MARSATDAFGSVSTPTCGSRRPRWATRRVSASGGRVAARRAGAARRPARRGGQHHRLLTVGALDRRQEASATSSPTGTSGTSCSRSSTGIVLTMLLALVFDADRSCSSGGCCCRGRAPRVGPSPASRRSFARSAATHELLRRRVRLHLRPSHLAGGERHRSRLGEHLFYTGHLGADRVGHRDPARAATSGTPVGAARSQSASPAPRALCRRSGLMLLHASRSSGVLQRPIAAYRRVRDPRDPVDARRVRTRASRRSTGSTIDAARAHRHDRVADPLEGRGCRSGCTCWSADSAAATLQVVATATLAAYIDLGRARLRHPQGIPPAATTPARSCGAIARRRALALLVDALFAHRPTTRRPRGVSRGPPRATPQTPQRAIRRPRSVATRTPDHEKDRTDVHSKEQAPARLGGSRGRGVIDPGRVWFEHWRRLRRRRRRRRQRHDLVGIAGLLLETRSSPRSTPRRSRTPATR